MTTLPQWAPNSRWPAVALRHRYDVRLGKQLQPEAKGGADTLAPYLRAANVHWTGVRSQELQEMYASPQDLAMYEVRTGDLIVCEGGDVGRCSLLGADFPAQTIIQNAVHRLRAQDDRPLAFLAYCLRAAHGAGWLDVVCNRATIRHLTSDKLKALLIPDPEPDVQHQVVAFLDDEVGRLDAETGLLESLLALVTERKLRLISRAAGEGLDASVERKDAGEDGLRRVPVHWEVKALKWVTPRIQVGIVITPARYYVEKPGVPALRGLNVRPGAVSNLDLVYLSDEGHLINRKSELHTGDVVVVRTGSAGAAAVVPDWADGFNAVDILIVRRDDAIASEFLEYLLNSDFAIDQVARFSVGSLQAHFNVGALKQLLVAVPPKQEQQAIVEYLQPRVQQLDALADRTVQDLMLLAQRRHALLTAAVTGTLDEPEEALAA